MRPPSPTEHLWEPGTFGSPLPRVHPHAACGPLPGSHQVPDLEKACLCLREHPTVPRGGQQNCPSQSPQPRALLAISHSACSGLKPKSYSKS